MQLFDQPQIGSANLAGRGLAADAENAVGVAIRDAGLVADARFDPGGAGHARIDQRSLVQGGTTDEVCLQAIVLQHTGSVRVNL